MWSLPSKGAAAPPFWDEMILTWGGMRRGGSWLDLRDGPFGLSVCRLSEPNDNIRFRREEFPVHLPKVWTDRLVSRQSSAGTTRARDNLLPRLGGSTGSRQNFQFKSKRNRLPSWTVVIASTRYSRAITLMFFEKA